MSILDKASLIQIPSGYKSTKLYSVKPSNGNGDFTFARSSSATRVDSAGLVETMSANVPRLDYSGGATFASLLLEGQSTNLINYSESLSNTNRSGTFVDNSAISPDGTQNATKITATSTDPFFYQSVTLNAATYTASLWVKGIGNSIGKEFRFAISNQTHVGNRYTIPSVWTRFEFTASVSAGSVTTGVEIPDPAVVGDEVLAWGWQLEESSYATSYIPSNSGSSTTRTADVCNNAGTSATFNSTEGVLFAEIAALYDDLTYRLISIENTSDAANNFIYLGYNNSSNTIRTRMEVAGSAVTDMQFVLSDETQFNKCAVKWKQNDFALWVNGVEVATDSSGSSFSANTLDRLSFNRNSTLEFLGNTKQLMVFDEALSDSELTTLTT
jgi:hypothetical protein